VSDYGGSDLEFRSLEIRLRDSICFSEAKSGFRFAELAYGLRNGSGASVPLRGFRARDLRESFVALFLVVSVLSGVGDPCYILCLGRGVEWVSCKVFC
jgi:hypothetical protein